MPNYRATACFYLGLIAVNIGVGMLWGWWAVLIATGMALMFMALNDSWF